MDIDQLQELYPDFTEEQLNDLYDRMHGDIPDHSSEPYPHPNSDNQNQSISADPETKPLDNLLDITYVEDKKDSVSPMDLVTPQPSKTVTTQQKAPIPRPQVPSTPPVSSEPPTGVDLSPSPGQNTGQYSDQNRALLEQKVNEANSPPNIVAGIGALGAGLAGFNPIREGLHLLDRQNAGNNSALTQFDQRKAQAGESDPNSPQSKIAQSIALKVGVKPEIASKLTAAQFKAFSPVFLKMYEQEMANQRTKTTADASIQKKESGGTIGQQAVDRGYQKDYNDYISTGRIGAIATIEKLKALKEEIDEDVKKQRSPRMTGEGSGGWMLATLPDFLNPAKAVTRRDNARNFANQTLKQLFGGSISDSERASAANEFYNERDNDAGNSARLGQKIKELEQMRASQDAKALFFKRHGTLNGFGENLPGGLIQDRSLSPGDIENGYKYKGGDPTNQQSWEPVK